MVDDQPRTKCTVANLNVIDYVAECKLLLEAIAKY